MLEYPVRTTLTIADDVLEAAKAIARERGVSVGDAISDLARRSLQAPQPGGRRNGVPLLPTRKPETVVTLEMVNALRDEAP